MRVTRKTTVQWAFIITIVILGVIFSYVMFRKSHQDYLNAPKIRFENAINLDVKKISFERNGLFLNGQQYNADGISGYTEVHHDDSIYKLGDMQPPFHLAKAKQNDTLFIIKGDKRYYLLVTEEIKRSKVE